MRLHHICIQTKCYKETIEFYTEIMGFELVKENIYVPKRIKKVWLKKDGLLFEVLPPKCSQPYDGYEKLREGMPHMSFIVDDAEREYQRIRESGFSNFKSRHGKFIYRIKGGKQFKLVAPEGTEIEIRDCEI